MSDKTIDDVTPDTNVTGVEKLPVSDGGTPKSVTVEQVKDFVLAKINALPASQGVSVSSDGIFIKKDGSLKPTSAENVANMVISHAFGSDAAESVEATDVIVLSKSGVTKKTTLADIAQYVVTSAGLSSMNIHGLTSKASVDAADEFPIYDVAGVSNKKVSFTVVAEGVLSGISGATVSQSEIGANDYIVTQVSVGEGASAHLEFRRVKRSDAGIGSGNVTGPATVTDGEFARFDGNTGRAINGGISLTTTIGSTSSDAQIPTAKTVYDNYKGVVFSTVGSHLEDITGRLCTMSDNTGTNISCLYSVNKNNSLASSSSDYEVPSVGATKNYVASQIAARTVRIVQTSGNNLPDISQYEEGAVVFWTNANGTGLRTRMKLLIALRKNDLSQTKTWFSIGTLTEEEGQT